MPSTPRRVLQCVRYLLEWQIVVVSVSIARGGSFKTRWIIVRLGRFLGLWGRVLGLCGLLSGLWALHVRDAYLVKPSAAVLRFVGIESDGERHLLALFQVKLGDVVLTKYTGHHAVGISGTTPCEVLEQVLLTFPGVTSAFADTANYGHHLGDASC